MSHLKQEVRVNKNGVPVTKHVLADPNAGSDSKTPIPAPNAQQSPVVIAERAAQEFESMFEDFGAVSLENNFKFLAENKPRLLNKIMDEVRKADEAELLVWKFVLNEGNHLGTPAYKEEDNDEDYDAYLRHTLYPIQRMAANVSLSTKLFPDEAPHSQMIKTYKLASKAESAIGWRADQSPKKYVENQAAMILAETSAYKLDGFKGFGPDIFYIADNMDKVIPLLPELRKRNQTSKGLIEALLDNESSALVDGVL